MILDDSGSSQPCSMATYRTLWPSLLVSRRPWVQTPSSPGLAWSSGSNCTNKCFQKSKSDMFPIKSENNFQCKQCWGFYPSIAASFQDMQSPWNTSEQMLLLVSFTQITLVCVCHAMDSSLPSLPPDRQEPWQLLRDRGKKEELGLLQLSHWT